MFIKQLTRHTRTQVQRRVTVDMSIVEAKKLASALSSAEDHCPEHKALAKAAREAIERIVLEVL